MDIHQLEAYVAHQIRKYRKFLVAFSGGLDSTVLLYLLVQLRQRSQDLSLRAVHIHHGLSALSDSWADHCSQQCAAWKVPITVQKIQINSRIGGIEAAARTGRRAAFKETLRAEEILVTAQNLNDQSETFLLALKRGSGPAGLSAMTARSRLGNHLLLRPLLSCSRLQIEAYAQKQQLSWINDDSNKNLRFDRNFLRLKVLPLLNLRWPYFISSVARSASLCEEQEQLLDELLTGQLHTLLAEDDSLTIHGLLGCSPERRFALLRRWIARHNVMPPSRKQLNRLWDEVALSRIDATPQLQLGSYQIRRFHGRLYLLSSMTSLRDICLNWSRTSPLTLPDGLGYLISGQGQVQLRSPQPSQQVSVRFGAQGSVRILGRTHARPIKKIWQELGVPPWLRERIPLIYYDDQLIAALNVFICIAGKVSENEPLWRIHWNKKNNLTEQE